MKSMMDSMENRAFILFLAFATLAFFMILRPFFGAIFWAVAITVIFYPLKLRLEKHWGHRRNVNALVVLLVALLLVIVPIATVITVAIDEIVNLVDKVKAGDIDPGRTIEQVRARLPLVEKLLNYVGLQLSDIENWIKNTGISIGQSVAKNSLSLGQSTAGLLLDFCIMLYVAFFILRDGHFLVQSLYVALPLGDAREELLFRKFAEVTRATVKGNLIVAFVQGGIGGLAFWFLGVPAAAMWMFVMAIASMLPAVGAAIIWLPVAIYFLINGQITEGIILLVVGGGVISTIDNILRPILVGRDTKLPDYVVLISTLGGISLFGINGFVIGPLIAALFFASWEIFMREFQSEKIFQIEKSENEEESQ